jgi:hypothetical protein
MLGKIMITMMMTMTTMMMIIIIFMHQFSPHECALGDKRVQILLSGSHGHACTLEKMTPKRYGHLEPENTTNTCHYIQE